LKYLAENSKKSIDKWAGDLTLPVSELAKPSKQNPVYYYGLTGPWCFDGCDNEGVPKVTSAVDSHVVSATDVSPRERDEMQSGGVVPSGDPMNDPRAITHQPINAVYIGRQSFVSDCEKKRSTPFGCDLLRTVSKPTTRESVAGKAITVIRRTFAYKSAPAIRQNQAYYGCKVAVLEPRSRVKVLEVAAIEFRKDTFYWAAVNAVSDHCESQPKQSPTYRALAGCNGRPPGPYYLPNDLARQYGNRYFYC
jgi:hypothetical protein